MKKALLILLASLLLLTGCSSGSGNVSKGVTVKWRDGVISFNGKDSDLTEYGGYYANAAGGKAALDWQLKLDTATDVTNITDNVQGILEENMDKYKNMFYYTEYLGSLFTGAESKGGDNWYIVRTATNGLSPSAIAAYAKEYINSVPLTNGSVTIDFGSFTLSSQYDVVIARTDCCLITGIIKVSKGYYDCQNPVSIMQGKKEYQLMKGSSANYDYYMYDDYLIQISAGLDITQYIKFK